MFIFCSTYLKPDENIEVIISIQIYFHDIDRFMWYVLIKIVRIYSNLDWQEKKMIISCVKKNDG